VFALAMTACAQVSGPGAWVPSQNGTTGQSDPMPYYFSGTGCRASGVAVCPGLVGGEPNWIAEAWLGLNGQNLKHWQQPEEEPSSTTKDLELVFDSTHFPPGTQVEVQFRAKDRLGNFYPANGPATGTAVVKNTARFYSYPQTAAQPGGNGALAAYYLVSHNHYGRTVNYVNWSAPMLADQIDDAGIWYVNAHSTPSSHTTYNILEDVYDWPHEVDPNYLDWRGAANGSGYPPFNSTQKPPVHLAIFHGCDTGETDVFRPILRPFQDAWWPIPYANQASIGFEDKALVVEAELFVQRFFSLLMEGRTIENAVFKFIERNTNEEEYAEEPKVHVYLFNDDVPPVLLSSVDQLPIAGDRFTRVRSVYRSGSHAWTSSEDWWR